MALTDITGRQYGPVAYRLGIEKVADFIEATGDDPDRWREEAPPGFAGALLFAVAPILLADPDLATHSHGVIHGDQSFIWYRPFTYGLDLLILGTVSKLRERGGVAFLGFDMNVSDGDGPLCEGASTFVLSGDRSAASGHHESAEPAPDHRTVSGNGREHTATRRDLVKYAGASRDFNPLHWDHATAVAAGLPGVVVHGLMQSAWMLLGMDSIRSVRFRYRQPLLPSVPVRTNMSENDRGGLDATLTDGRVDYVTAKIERAELGMSA